MSFGCSELWVLGDLGLSVGDWAELSRDFGSDEERFIPWGLALTLAGIPLGALLAPYLSLKPWGKGGEYISSIPGSTLVSGTAGLLVGLIVAALVSIPLFGLDGWLGWGVPVMLSFFLGFCGLWIGVNRGGTCKRFSQPWREPTARPSRNETAVS